MHLVVGASGTLGSRVCLRLLEQGEQVRAVSRDPGGRLAELEEHGADVYRGDLRDASWMEGALHGVNSVVLAAHGLVPPSRENHPGFVDEAGNRRLIDAAKKTGVQRAVLLSVAGAAPDAPMLFWQVKHRAEEHLKGSGLSYAIVRPTVYMETHALLLLGEPLRSSGEVQFFGPGTTPVNWISADDVADHVVRMLRKDAPGNVTSTIGGEDVLSRVEALGVIERTLGLEAKRRHLPLAAIRAMKWTIGPFHPGMRYLLDAVVGEARLPGHPAVLPTALDWTGPSSLEGVVERWAAQTS